MSATSDRKGGDHPFAPVEAFRAALSAGDGDAVAAAHVSGEVTIIDNVAPFIWSGVTSVSTWLSDMAADAQLRGLSDQEIAYEAAITELVVGDRAYGIYPAKWTYRENSILQVERATIAFALRRTSAGWKIAGWSWNPIP